MGGGTHRRCPMRGGHRGESAADREAISIRTGVRIEIGVTSVEQGDLFLGGRIPPARKVARYLPERNRAVPIVPQNEDTSVDFVPHHRRVTRYRRMRSIPIRPDAVGCCAVLDIGLLHAVSAERSHHRAGTRKRLHPQQEREERCAHRQQDLLVRRRTRVPREECGDD